MGDCEGGDWDLELERDLNGELEGDLFAYME